MPATTDYLPYREADLVQWSSTFDAYISVNFAAVGLDAGQVASYNALHVAFSDAWNLANANTTRTPSVIEAKDDAKAALISGPGGIRKLVKIIQAFPGTTNTMRRDMGITVPDSTATPIGPPETKPVIEDVKVNSHTVSFRLHDDTFSGRGKPEFVTGAFIYTFVGDEPPTNIKEWSFEGTISKTEGFVNFPLELAPGTKVWIIAQWSNAKHEVGQAGEAASAYLSGGAQSAAA